MRMTLRIDNALGEQAKRAAARSGMTLSAFVEQGLRLMLAQSCLPGRRPCVMLPVCRAGGGLLQGVNLSDSASLWDIMEGPR